MTVIGVASASFRGVDIGEVSALWIPAAMKLQATPAPRRRQAVGSALAEVRSLPEVESVSITGLNLLSGGSWNNPMTIEAHRPVRDRRLVHMGAVSPGFFRTLGTPVVAGRDFDERDVGFHAPPEAVRFQHADDRGTGAQRGAPAF
jgi:hypothetical protein